jgi:hypothetical protein
MKVIEIPQEHWAELLEEIEEKLGEDKRRFIEHVISSLEEKILRYELEKEEEDGYYNAASDLLCS